jgi:hypothetical protein
VKPFIVLLFALASGTALAQAEAGFSLHDGRVQFQAPTTWTAIMEKRDGNPQAIAFQVPNAAAAGSADAADVTVKTRQLQGPADYVAAVAAEQARARAQDGYEADGAADDGQHRYFIQRGGTRYLVRDSFRLLGDIAVEVRCRRPLLAATPASWHSAFDSGCDRLVSSLQP